MNEKKTFLFEHKKLNKIKKEKKIQFNNLTLLI